MAKPEEIVTQTAETQKGKKAKLKPLVGEPEGTKAKPLPGPLKKALKDSFGCDFSKVRVHSGGNTAELSKAVKARAFTIGNDIYFKNPSDAGNLKLIAHELTHVVQQGNGRIPQAKPGKALISK